MIARLEVTRGTLTEYPLAERTKNGWQNGVTFYPDAEVTKVTPLIVSRADLSDHIGGGEWEPLNIERENAAAEHVRQWLRSGSCGDVIEDQVHNAFVSGAEWERNHSVLRPQADLSDAEIERMGPAAGCAYCVGAGGYEDHGGGWVECSCRVAEPQGEPSDAQVSAVMQALIKHDKGRRPCYAHFQDFCCPCGEHGMSRTEWQQHQARAALRAAGGVR